MNKKSQVNSHLQAVQSVVLSSIFATLKGMRTYVKMKILFESCTTHFNNKVRGESSGITCRFTGERLALQFEGSHATRQ